MSQSIIRLNSTLPVMLCLLLLVAGASVARQPASLQQTIGHLLDTVNQSGLTFNRNGESYTASEAANHMHNKYEHFQDEINTAEDFIRLCATRSLVSGKPYTLVGSDGREMATADWLTRVLSEYRDKETGAGQ